VSKIIGQTGCPSLGSPGCKCVIPMNNRFIGLLLSLLLLWNYCFYYHSHNMMPKPIPRINVYPQFFPKYNHTHRIRETSHVVALAHKCCIARKQICQKNCAICVAIVPLRQRRWFGDVVEHLESILRDTEK